MQESQRAWVYLLSKNVLRTPRSRHCTGMFLLDKPLNTHFSINSFTSIGLGSLTEEMHDHLKVSRAFNSLFYARADVLFLRMPVASFRNNAMQCQRPNLLTVHQTQTRPLTCPFLRPVPLVYPLRASPHLWYCKMFSLCPKHKQVVCEGNLRESPYITQTVTIISAESAHIAVLNTFPDEGHDLPDIALITEHSSSQATTNVWHRCLGHLKH